MNLLAYLLFVIIGYPISILPFWLLYRVSDIFAFLLRDVFHYRKKVIYQNLSRSFPEKSPAEIEKIAGRFYVNLADIIVETIKMLTVSSHSMRKRCTFKNPEVIETYYSENKSVIALASHYGNWELGNHGLTLNSKQKVLAIYKSLSNKYFDTLMYNMRCKFGTLMMDMKKMYPTIISYKDEPTISVMVADQTPSDPTTSIWVNFLNQDTLVFLGTEKIAMKTNYPLLYCNLQREKRGYYSVEFIELFDQPNTTSENEITVAYTKLLEKIITEKPENWLWSHKRWKHQKD